MGRVNNKPPVNTLKKRKKLGSLGTLTLSSARAGFCLLTLAQAVSGLAGNQSDAVELMRRPFHFGPFFEQFPLTTAPGTRTEVLGPLFSREVAGSTSLFTFSPLFSLYRDSAVDQTELKIGYPALAFEHYGSEYRFHIFQVISWSGGETLKGGDVKRTTLFPFYFRQTSPRPEENYTAVVPFYGHIKNRFFRDEAFFVMLPLYIRSTKRGVVTENYAFPFFHTRHGAGVDGWQFFPFYQTEHKDITVSTNNWGDRVESPGYDRKGILWPFYFNNTLGIGSTNVQKQFVLLPFYTSQVSPTRESKSYGFPLGVTHTIDREAKYEEWDAPWPLVEFAKGEGKTTTRVFPFYSEARTPTSESSWYAWPIYKYNRITSEPLNRERTRILLYLYSDTLEQNTTKHTSFHRRDFWPLFTWRKDHQDNSRLQIFSVLEPILPASRSVERVYSQLYSVYRQEESGSHENQSRSILWNLYRYDKRGDLRTHRLFFGLFQREKDADRTRWRIFFIPFTTGAKPVPASEPAPAQ